MKNIPRVLLAVFVLLSGLALTPFVELPKETFQWQRYASAYQCDQDCLRVSVIRMQGIQQGANVRVRAKVRIVDENGVPVAQAQVRVKQTFPNGAVRIRTATTRPNGGVRFKFQDGVGTYTIEILSVTKAGSTFDPKNSVLMETFTIP